MRRCRFLFCRPPSTNPSRGDATAMTNGGSGSFQCTLCQAPTGVLDSRPGPGGRTIRRRRICRTCENRFTTYELAVEEYANVFGLTGIEEEIDRAVVAMQAVRDRVRLVRESAELIDEMKRRR